MVPHLETPPTSGNAPAFRPPSSPVPRLSAGKTQVARSTTPTGVPQRPFQPPVEKKQNPLLKYALIGLGVVALGVGGYYGYPLIGQARDKFNATSAAAAKRPVVGGDVGAAMDVNDALNRTDPSGPAPSLKASVKKRLGGRRVPGVPSAGDSAMAAADNGGPDGSGAASADKDLPVVAPVHTMDVSRVTIPVSKVNGVISGGSFVADKARINKIATAYALTLRQGAGLTPDRAVRVFLHLQGDRRSDEPNLYGFCGQ